MHDAHLTRLILAIEPDRGKASQLKSIARQVGAELQLVDSVDGALAAIGERMPDLILTPALLSAREDSTLTGRLRGLGEAAAHIQTLTIPILENALAGANMFGALRRDRIRDRIYAAAPDACGTDTFAQQVSVYLERATEGLHRHAPISTPGPLRADAVAAAPATQSAAQVGTPSGQLPPADASAFLADSNLDAFISEDMLGLDPDPTPEPQAIDVDMPDIPLPIDDAEAISDALSDFVSENLARVIAEKPAEKPAAKPDTWRLFDPAEPRFAALLEKLDDIAGPAS